MPRAHVTRRPNAQRGIQRPLSRQSSPALRAARGLAARLALREAVGPGPRQSRREADVGRQLSCREDQPRKRRRTRRREADVGRQLSCRPETPARRACQARRVSSAAVIPPPAAVRVRADRGGMARVTPTFQRTARSRRGGSPQQHRPYHFHLRFSTPSWGRLPFPGAIKSPWTRTPLFALSWYLEFTRNLFTPLPLLQTRTPRLGSLLPLATSESSDLGSIQT